MKSYNPTADRHNTDLKVKRGLDRRQRLINNMHKFATEVTASDCAGISGQGQKVEYKNVHKSMKKKGGSPPKDYTAVEMLIDFKAAMKAAQYDEARPLYFGLRRMLGWDQQ